MNITDTLIRTRPIVRPRERRRARQFWLRDFAPWAIVGAWGLIGIGGGGILLALAYLRAVAPGLFQ